MKLPFTTDEEVRWRWQQRIEGRGRETLHRVASFERKCTDEDPGCVGVVGAVTACGLEVPILTMPGIFSRMGAPRCKKCCEVLGIADGKGAPFNAKPEIVEPTEVVLPDRWGVFGLKSDSKRPLLAGPFRSKGAATRALKTVLAEGVVLPIVEVPKGT